MKIFVINLKSSTERKKHVQQILSDIDFTFFEADNLSETPNHFIYKLYNPKKTQILKGYTLTTAELGCFASHVSLWKKCVQLDEPILILEDNIELLDDFKSYLSVIERLVNEYGILKLYDIYPRKHKVIRKVDSTYNVVSNLKGGCGTQAYVITPNVAASLLEKTDGFFEPVDDFIESEWRTKQTVYSLSPFLVKRSEVKSSIGNRKIKDKANIKHQLYSELYRTYQKIRQAMYNLRYK